jgi:hypothetical protein
MRKILFLISFLIIQSLFAQIKEYNELGVLLTNNSNKQTTARSMSMKGAFGALGGDLSSLSINPAGAAIFNHSAASLTVGYSDNLLTSDFYGTSVNNENENLNFSQFGGVLVFENYDNNYSINKLAFAVNYNLLNNFNNTWISEGLSKPTWVENYFNANDTFLYNNLESQKYTNVTSGNQSELNFTLAADIEDKVFYGFSLNAYDFRYIEDASRLELANDGNGHTVDAYESFWQEVKGEGLSFSTGLIFKPVHSIRLGLSYTSPIWYYDVHEDSNMYTEDNNDFIGYYDVLYSFDPPSYSNNSDKILAYDYALKTPSKLTGSLALIFNKSGLISLDVTRQNYKGITFKPKFDFMDVNSNFDENMKDTYAFNFGSEWRIDNLSVRGGYSYAQDPYLTAIESDNLQGYSFGVGLNFGNYVFDIAYDKTERTGYTDFYPDFNDIYGAELNKVNKTFLATLTYKF